MPRNNFSHIMPIAITAKAKFSLHRLKMAKFLKMSFLVLFRLARTYTYANVRMCKPRHGIDHCVSKTS